MFRNNGYQVHLRVMAVPAIISKLSIFLRYETQLAEKGFARWTRMEDHDDRFENLKINLIEIIENKKPDSIKSYERVLELLGTTQLRCLESESMKVISAVAIIEMKVKIKKMIQKRGGDLREFEEHCKFIK